MKRSRFILLLVAVFLVNYGLDRITKIAAETWLKDADSIVFLDRLIVIGYAENLGAFLGLGGTWPFPLKAVLFIALPALVCLYGLYWSAVREKSFLRAALITTVIAGGMSNLQDRLLNDFRVVDFLNFGIGPVFRTGILNVADLSVTFGAIALVILELRRPKPVTPEKDGE